MTSSRRRTTVIALIGLGLLIVGFFGLRTVQAFKEFRGHRPPPPFQNAQAETDVELIRDWMTIPFIARMYHIPPPVLFESLQVPKDRTNEEKSLKQLNDEYFPDQPDHVLTTVKATLQTSLPPPTAAVVSTPIP